MSVRHGRRSGYPQITMDDIRVGSIVRIKSREWYDKHKNDVGFINCGRAIFTEYMCDFLDSDVVVKTIVTGRYFKIFESDYVFTPEMVEYVVKY